MFYPALLDNANYADLPIHITDAQFFCYSALLYIPNALAHLESSTMGD